MADFYENMRDNVASPLIKKFGKAITFTRDDGTSVLDPVTGQYTGGSPINISGYGIQSYYKKEQIDGKLVQKNDVKFVCVDLSEVPVPGDTATFGGSSYSVIDVQPIKPADTAVVFIVQARV